MTAPAPLRVVAGPGEASAAPSAAGRRGVRGAQPPRLVGLLRTSESLPPPGPPQAGPADGLPADAGTTLADAAGQPLPQPPRRLRYIEACRHQQWHLRLWKKGEGPAQKGALRVPYRCGSWRHRGRCAKEKNHADFTRIAAALEGHAPEHVLLSVLTFKNAEWSNPEAAYRSIVKCWRSLAKAIRRNFGGMRYVCTIEKTGVGMPHLNVIMVAPTLGQVVAEQPRMALAWLKKRARRCGFGWRASLEVAKNKRHVAGYIVKLADASGLDDDAQALLRGTYGYQRTAGEVAKLSQVPTNAPRGFRRLRASPRFLPNLDEPSEYTGELCTAPLPETQDAQQDAARFDALMEAQTLTTAELAQEPEGYRRMREQGVPAPVGQGNHQRVDQLHVEAPAGEELFDGVAACEGQQWREGRLYLANELGGRPYWENVPMNWALDAEAHAREWLDAHAPGWREEVAT